MAVKKKEAALQVSISNQTQWEKMLSTTGLTVVDVYQKWCGPCKAIVRHLRKVKNELGDVLLHFATAEADSIEDLKMYRGKCTPTFLFYADGMLVGVLQGANPPLLQKTIVKQLAKEKQSPKEGEQHKPIKPFCLMDDEDKDGKSAMTVPTGKSYTVAIIKPDAVSHRKTNEIIMKIQESGFEILAHKKHTLTDAEARRFYQHKAEEPCFQDLVQFMSSGHCHVLVLSHTDGSVNVLSAWLEFMGPTDVNEARKVKPESLRAQYGTETLHNAVHGSEDSNRASRELAFFFPNFRVEQDGEEERVERTLALIRPGLARENRDEILAQIHKSGLTVSLQREVTLTEEQVRLLYFQYVNEDYFPALLQSMNSGPVSAMVLTGKEAVHHWKNIIGPSDLDKAKAENPECLRARFAVENEPINQIHGSENQEAAEREISFFFPKQNTLAVIKHDAMEQHRETILEEIRGRGFCVTQQKEMVPSRELAEELYKEHKEKPFFNQLVDSMCQGPCLMLVLTKENAVEEWRVMMGPSDPAKAKETSPESLRARFGSDILQNSVHGSSNTQHAEEEIHLIFCDISTEPELSNTETN
ncbi:thioredoxin domain-containing protein 6 isoform X1 [Oryzias melastigma]|uniref:Nucleoside diphosphate kinase B n=3 Tax=Oryzias melastigma TaxID=30732 RepID=A0A3B3CXJ7_ORYME|nr:thioredoxin domain-containing protein 6 isoform X1 [Oryzias melastigma]